MGSGKPSLDEIFSDAPKRASLDDIFGSKNTEDGSLPEGLSPSDAGDSSIRGFLNAFTAGHMPQIAGAVEHPIGALKTLIEGGSGHDVSQDADVAAYAKTRDQYKNLYDKAWKDHPVAYGTGYAPGVITSPVNKLGAASAGALIGEGSTGADLTKGQIDKEIADTAKGLVMGGILGKAASAASPVFQYIAKKLLPQAAESAVINHLQPTAAESRALGNSGLHSMAREMLDRAQVKPFTKVGTTAENLAGLLDDAAGAGTAQSSPKKAPGPPPLPAQNNDVLNSQWGKYAPEIEQNDALSAARQSAQPALEQTVPDTLAVQEARKLLMRKLGKSAQPAPEGFLDSQWGKLPGNASDELAGASEPTQMTAPSDNLLAAKKMADRAADSNPHGFMSNLADVGLTAHAVTHMSPYTAAAAAAHVATKGRIASTVAVGLDNVSKVLQSAPEKLGQFAQPLLNAAQRGGNSLAVTNYLMGQSNPAYRMTLERAVSGDESKKP